MYKCQLCKQVTPPHTKAHRLVIETRYKRYPDRPKSKWNPTIFVFGGEGREIVREIIICPTCAAQQPHSSGFT